jgi:hypothetical protein
MNMPFTLPETLFTTMKNFFISVSFSFFSILIFGQGSVLLNAANNGLTLTAVQSGAGAGQFNCGATFYDDGGAGSDYALNADNTVTLCAAAGQYLSITLTSVSISSASGGSANPDYFTVNVGSGFVTVPNTGGSGPSSITYESTVGGCISFRLDANPGTSSNGFSGTISCVTPPPNDNPCGALPLSAFNTCNPVEVSNVGAQNTTGYPGVSSCAGYNGSDVWYRLVVPSDGNISFSSTAGTITDGGLAAYTSSNGTCTGTFTQIACNDDCSSPVSLMPCLSISNPALAGQTIWIRLWDYAGNTEGTFNVCAIGNVGSCTPTTADCLGAIPVCSNTSYSNLASGQGCTADLNSGNDGCLAGEHNMTYYVIRIGSSGTWGFEGSFPVTSNGIEYDWALWQLSGNPLTTSSACSLSAPIRCSYASQAGKSEVAMGMVSSQSETEENSSPSGDGYVHWLDAATAGQYYLLGIDRWSTAGGAYTINFTGSATMSCDIMTVLPVVLVNFDGKPLERENKIYWTTASQTNNDYFTVEKSKNGISWEVMSTVQGMGTTADVIEYSVLDYDPFSLTYYRLKQTDYDGTVKTFDPIVVSRNSDESELFSELYPNPTTGDVYFNYTGSNFTEPIEVTLYSTTGGRMTKHGYVSFNNYQGLNIDCKDLSNGVYSVTLRQGSKIEHKKFTIIR